MEVSPLWCHPQSPATLLMPQVLGQGLDKGQGIQGTGQWNRPLAYSVLGLWGGRTRMGQEHLEPSRTKETWVVG